MLSLSIGANIALPFISLISFVGGSLESLLSELAVTLVGVKHVGTDDVTIGDIDLLDFDSLLYD